MWGNMKNKKILKGLVGSVISAVLCVCICLPIFASSTDNIIDASRPGSLYNESIDSAELLEKILDEYASGYEIGEAEKAYLVKYCDTGLTYNYAVGSGSVSASYDETSKKLSITAYEYAYASPDKGTVKWIPVSAEIGGENKLLEKNGSDGYFAAFSGVSGDDESATVKVRYSLGISIDRTVAARLINLAYSSAPSLIAEHEQRLAEYEARVSAYGEALAEYEKYLSNVQKYNSDLDKYNAYLRALTLYNEKREEYDQYLIDKAEYDMALAVYNNYLSDVEEYKSDYLKYQTYLEALEEYEKNVILYETYNADREICEYHRSIMWLSAERVYDDLHAVRSHLIYNGIIQRILDERATFTGDMGEAPPALFDMAAEATEKLKVLIPDYFASDTAKGKYASYSANYEELRKSFTNLFISLHYLQSNPTVSSAIISEGKTREYNVFVATLYLIAQRLNDGELKSVDPALVAGSYNAKYYKQYVFTDDNYRGINGVTLSQILGDFTVVPDTNNSKPVAGGYPPNMEKPKKPAEVSCPTAPQSVAPPVEPDAVSAPGDAPVKVENPGRAPAEVAEPTVPEPYIQDSVKAELIEAYLDGKIAERGLIFNTDPTITFNTTVEKRFLNVKQHIVRFYNTDRKTVIYSAVVETGDMVDYSGMIPTKNEDARATYTFEGWIDEVGNRVDLSAVTSDMSVYPSFSESIKSYTVKWNVAGNITETTVPYGELPVYDSVPKKNDDDYYSYTFAGWDKKVVAVTGNAVYTAVFDKHHLIPVTGGGASLGKTENGYVLDLTKCTDESTDIIAAIKKADSDISTLIVKIKTVSVLFSVSEVSSLSKLGACYISAHLADLGVRGANYKISLTDANGKILDSGYKFKISAQCNLAPGERLRLAYYSGSERKYQKYALEDKVLSFTAENGVQYLLSYEYNVIPTSSDLVTIGIGSGMYSAGEMVALNIIIPEGVSIKRVYYTDSNGNNYEIKDGGFIMPESDITVMVEAIKLKYKVTFINEGAVISEQYYDYGALPVAPSNPTKVSDGKYNYTFAGWSSEISAVTEDVTYTALYESEEIPENLDTDRGLTYLEKGVTVAIVVVAAIMLLVIVVMIVKIRLI